MVSEYSQVDLEAYLDEGLPPEKMAEIERALRGDKRLCQRLAAINARRDAGVHSLGEIWRRQRLSCPTREQLGGYLLGALSDDVREYVAFHLEVIQCRFCLANHDDLRLQQAELPATEARRRKYFQSSAGLLRK